MTLNINIPNTDSWLRSRKRQPLSEYNVQWINKLSDIVYSLDKRYKGIFLYSNYLENTLLDKSARFLMLDENSPVFHFFKPSSSDLIANSCFNDLDFWKTSSIDENILNRFSVINLNKYPQGDNKTNIDNYILFVLQDVTPLTFNIKTFISIIDWSYKNKKTILFKIHPACRLDDQILYLFKVVKNTHPSKYYRILSNSYNIDELINNAKAVWSFNSGVSLTALLKEKPAVSFMNSPYNPLCRLCKSPEEAYLATLPQKEELLQYLSWYYNRFVIDISATNAKERIEDLFDLFYTKKKPLRDILRLDWK
jgi:hypothetical protein